MSSRLNKILYNYDIFDTADSIIVLEPYMVNNSILPITTNIIKPNISVIPPSYNNQDCKTDKFSPKQDDTLFWSVFIAHYGLKEFFIVDRYKNREIEEKEKIVNYLKTLSKPEIHITKCSIQEMMGELMVAKNTTLFIVNALCMYYKMSFLFVYDNTYLEFDLKKLLTNYDNEIPIGIIYKNGSGTTKYNKFSVDLNVTKEKIQNILDTKVLLVKYDRPLRGISTYKNMDLEIILHKLQPNLGEKNKKITKKDMYEQIWRLCLTFVTI